MRDDEQPGRGEVAVIRVAVHSASPFARDGLEHALASNPRFEIATAGSLEGSEEPPDVILVDEAAFEVPRLRSTLGDDQPSKFVLLTDALDPVNFARLFPLGVRAVLPRDSTPSEIAAALEAAYQDLTVLVPEFVEALLHAARDESQAESLQEPLTAREMEVLTLLAEGAGNKEIGAKLNISENTAKFHVSSILGKLGAMTRTEAVSRGYRLGLILI